MPKQFATVQYLRGISAIMVVLFHCEVQLDRFGYVGPWPGWLAGGVDIFFVISGFVMWITTADRPITPLAFYWRRIARIVPLYWLITSFSVAVMLGTPALVQTGQFNLYHVIASYLFVPAIHPVTHQVEPVLQVGWTLNLEMFFYALFGALLLASRAYRLPAMAVCLGGIVLLAALLPSQSLALQFYGFSIVLEFVMGMALAIVIGRGWQLPRASAWCAIIAGFVGLVLFDGGTLPHALIAGVPSLAIVAGCVSLECVGPVPEIRPMHVLGDASYSLYLSHPIVLSAAGQIWLRLPLGPSLPAFAAFIVLATLLSAVIAVILYRCAERPLLRLLSGRGSAHVRPVILPGEAKSHAPP